MNNNNTDRLVKIFDINNLTENNNDCENINIEINNLSHKSYKIKYMKKLDESKELEIQEEEVELKENSNHIMNSKYDPDQKNQARNSDSDFSSFEQHEHNIGDDDDDKNKNEEINYIKANKIYLEDDPNYKLKKSSRNQHKSSFNSEKVSESKSESLSELVVSKLLEEKEELDELTDSGIFKIKYVETGSNSNPKLENVRSNSIDINDIEDNEDNDDNYGKVGNKEYLRFDKGDEYKHNAYSNANSNSNIKAFKIDTEPDIVKKESQDDQEKKELVENIDLKKINISIEDSNEDGSLKAKNNDNLKTL